LVSALTLASASIAVIGSGALAVSAAAAVALPNPCSVLAAAHAQNTIARGHHVNAGKVNAGKVKGVDVDADADLQGLQPRRGLDHRVPRHQ
jgi:hypothetical protein